MLSRMYPFWSFVIAILLAQFLKPFVVMVQKKKFYPRYFFASGGFPSSHTAGVAALTMAVGINEKFDSTIFAVALALGIIVAYDAANVRYYAGKNISLTHQIVEDLSTSNLLETDDPIYNERIKEVLGHKWSEVLGGGILGVIVAILLYYLQ